MIKKELVKLTETEAAAIGEAHAAMKSAEAELSQRANYCLVLHGHRLAPGTKIDFERDSAGKIVSIFAMLPEDPGRASMTDPSGALPILARIRAEDLQHALGSAASSDQTTNRAEARRDQV